MKSSDQLICTNCKARLMDKRHVFQGVIICNDCFKIVSHTIKRTQEELKMLFLVYTDMIRVSLLKGEFRPPVMPPSGKKLPQEELAAALRQMAEKGKKHGANRESGVSELSGDAGRPDGEVCGG